MPTDTALMNLVKDSSRHEEVFQLFNSTAFDFFDHEDGQVSHFKAIWGCAEGKVIVFWWGNCFI